MHFFLSVQLSAMFVLTQVLFTATVKVLSHSTASVVALPIKTESAVRAERPVKLNQGITRFHPVDSN